jgi:hypothetical protein
MCLSKEQVVERLLKKKRTLTPNGDEAVQRDFFMFLDASKKAV